MKQNPIIHCLLVLALCVGQFASNVHIVGHLHGSEVISVFDGHHLPDRLMAHTDGHHHHDHMPHKQPNSTKAEADCTVYHAFAGLYGLKPVASCLVHVQSIQRTVRLQEPTSPIALWTDSHSIRGPPTLS